MCMEWMIILMALRRISDPLFGSCGFTFKENNSDGSCCDREKKAEYVSRRCFKLVAGLKDVLGFNDTVWGGWTEDKLQLGS